MDDETWLPIESGWRPRPSRSPRDSFNDGQQVGCHRSRPMQRHRPAQFAAIAVQRHILGEQIQQCLHISLRACLETALQELLVLLFGNRIAGPLRGQVLAGSIDDLTTAMLVFSHYPSDFIILVIKDLTKQEDGSFERRELFEQAQKSNRESFRNLYLLLKISHDQRFWQPCAHRRLTRG